MAADGWIMWTRSAAPPAAAIRQALLALAAALPVIALAAFASGMPAAVWAVLGLVMGTTSGAFLDTARSVPLTIAAAAMVAGAAAAAGRAVLVGCIVAGACVLAGLADRWSAGLLMLAPVTAAIAGSQRSALSWPVLGGWVLAGALYGVTTVSLLHTHLHPRALSAGRAALHAVMLATLCGTAAGLATALRLPHGYWIVLTLAVVLRPVVQESARRAVQRVAGTLLGVLIPIPLVLFLPRPAVVTIAAACVPGSVSYLFAGQYTRQTVLLTVAIVILASGASRASTLAAGEFRLAWTIVGAAVAAIAASTLWRIERDWPQ